MPYAITDHEYTLDGGSTVQDCTAEMDNGNGTATFQVGDVAKAAGQVGVRVKAATGRNASGWLFNTSPFTVSGSATTQLSSPAVTAKASETTVNAIRLDWANVAANAGYSIEYSADNATWQQAGTAAMDSVVYQHTERAADTLYYYRVTALGDGVTYTNSAPSAVVSARTLIHLDTFATLNAWAITNPNPDSVVFSIENEKLKIQMLPGTAAANSVSNNALSQDTFAFPFEMDLHLSVLNVSAYGVQRFSVMGAGGEGFHINRGIGAGSDPKRVTLELTTGGVQRHYQYYGDFYWELIKAVRFRFLSSTEYAAFVSNDLITWSQVGPTFAHAFTGPVKMRISGNESPVEKIVYVDTFKVSRP